MANKKSPPQQKIPPRWGGTDFGFNLGIPPGRGGLAEIPPTGGGDLPPPARNGIITFCKKQ